jgi:ATP-binding cassette subfamily F protein uup
VAQIWIHDVSVSLGGPLLLDGAALAVEAGERIGLVGRNGTGKTTLLRMLHGDIPPDAGEIVRSSGARVALLPQDVPDALPGTVYDIVASGGQQHLDLLHRYHELTTALARGSATGDGANAPGDAAARGAELLKNLERVQHRLEASGAWDFHQRVETVIGWTNLDGDAEFSQLSAGTKRRAFLARALADEPDVLLLDEPTNHLDIDSILWLEDFLLKFNKTIIFVTHDRAFLQRIATRIVEIDRGRLLSFDCDYDTYLERRQALWDAEEKAWQDFDKKLAKEEVWIRQGIKARRTRNEGRVRALEQLRLEREQRRERMGDPKIAIMEANRSGRLVADAEKITFAYDTPGAEAPGAYAPEAAGASAGRPRSGTPGADAAPIIKDFSTTIIRGDRVGILGPNGSGKTTLLKVLLGELTPQKGRVRLGANLEVAYFDQLRAQLDENRSLRDNIADGGDTVSLGKGSRHVVGYLQDFLFSSEQINAPARLLSGGERMRLLLAKLFAAPSNVLVLDEPTNDLDMETLALLEERLLSYSGTILLVSHDRAFLNNVVTSTIVFEGRGRLREYVGGYDDWLRQRPEPAATAGAKSGRAGTAGKVVKTGGAADPASEDQPGEAAAKAAQPRKSAPAAGRKLTYKETKELEALPAKIEALEAEIDALVATLNSSEFYARADAAEVTSTNARLEALQREHDLAFVRWEELEERSG